MEVAGVHWTVSVTTTLSAAWLVSASACRYRQLRPPILQTCAGFYSSSSQGDPAGARLPASALLSGLAQCGAALSSEQPDKDPRLGHGLGWLGLAAPGWAEEGAATPAQQRDWAGEARSCTWRDPAVPNHGAVPKLAVPEGKEFLKSLTIPSLPETFPPSSCSEERCVPLWGCCRSLCQPSQGDTLGLPRRAERTVKKVPRKQRGGKAREAQSELSCTGWLSTLSPAPLRV